jgi:superfamily II DNA helicase RecQ
MVSLAGPRSALETRLVDNPTTADIQVVIRDISVAKESIQDPLVVRQIAWVVRNVANQPILQRQLIDTVICLVTGAPEARKGQIDAVQRLAFDQEDTVLVAATGYGKSAVLYAYTAVTGLTTVQIVPLSKLGEAQLEDIKKNVPGSNPIFIDQETVKKDPRAWDNIEAGQYTHVLLSPEQALHPRFKKVLRNPSFHRKFGLFAVDELHVVGEWRKFRPEFTHLGALRVLMPQRVPFFGCTATLDKDNERFILDSTGFDGSLKIIRTSVDRPEISLVWQPLLRRHVTDFRRLLFLLDPNDGSLEITKTIVYVDSKPGVIALRRTLMRHLMEKERYSRIQARETIRRFDADVRKEDKDRIFEEFSQRGSTCRVLITTLAFGMGMNIPDVRRVVQWNVVNKKDQSMMTISDIWQRAGRAMRGIDGQGVFILFAPYWVFDHLGREKGQPSQGQPPVRRGRKRRKPLSRQAFAPMQPSGLRSEITPSDPIRDRDNQSVAGSDESVDSNGDARDQAGGSL